jgi:hypothetical protein
VTSEITRSWNNTPISRRAADGYVNATAMCKANGKLWADFWRTDRCTQYLEALSGVMGNPITGPKGLVQAQRGGNDQGTWVHPDVATELARWISPSFSVFVNQWFREEYEARLTRPAGGIPQLAPVEVAERILSVIRSVATFFDEMGGMDDRDRILLKDIARNQVLKLTGGSLPELPADDEMTISDAWLEVAGKAIPRDKAPAVGKLVAQLYREEFNQDPPKRLQYTDGAPRQVNSYRRNWLIEAIRKFHAMGNCH